MSSWIVRFFCSKVGESVMVVPLGFHLRTDFPLYITCFAIIAFIPFLLYSIQLQITQQFYLARVRPQLSVGCPGILPLF